LTTFNQIIDDSCNVSAQPNASMWDSGSHLEKYLAIETVGERPTGSAFPLAVSVTTLPVSCSIDNIQIASGNLS